MLNLAGIKKLDQQNKKILIRFDLNVPVNTSKESKELIINDRILRIKRSVDEIRKKNNKIIILSHLGRPKGKRDDNLSLKKILPQISQTLDHEVIFINDCIGQGVIDQIERASQNSVILLENCRFYKEEENNDQEFAKELSYLADAYVNDAFACSHRAHASVDAITKYIPSYCGTMLEEELLNLNQASLSPTQPAITILGGSKISTKITVLKKLSEKMDSIVIAGGMANNFLEYYGSDIKKSLKESNVSEICNEIVEFAKQNKCELVLPLDVTTSTGLDRKDETKISNIYEIEDNHMILDIGPQTVKKIKYMIDLASTVFWNGPVGVFEKKPFDKSTIEIAKYIAKRTHEKKINSFAGGGDTIAAMSLAGVKSDFTYVSTGGGALLELIEGKKLPGLVALNILE